MKPFKVTYTGNNSKFKNYESKVIANTEREATEKVFSNVLGENYFPQDDGSIKDSDGQEIAKPEDQVIEFDGGYFVANEIE